MNYEQAQKRWRLAQDLRDAFQVDGIFEGWMTLAAAAKESEFSSRELKALLRMGPISCGPVVFTITKNEKGVELHVHDEQYMEARAKLVNEWRRVLEKRGLEAAMEAISGFNLKKFDIDFQHFHPTTDGWRVAFEACDGEGRTPSEALVAALRRWVLGAPKVQGTPRVRRERTKQR